MATAETFRSMTAMTMDLADEVCDGRLAMVHEGGYSEVYVPFCGHAVLEQMSGSKVTAEDPLGATFRLRQPNAKFQAFLDDHVDGLVRFFDSPAA